MEDKIQELYKFFQQRYLWQFYSRSWDRDENINGILGKLPAILSGETLTVNDSSKERAYYAEAKTVAVEVEGRYPWAKSLEKAQLEEIITAVKNKIIDVTITNSQNGELNNQNY